MQLFKFYYTDGTYCLKRFRSEKEAYDYANKDSNIFKVMFIAG